MKIEGGTVTIMRDDELPTVTIVGATVLLDANIKSPEEVTTFMNEHMGLGSHINDCNVWPLEHWCISEANEALRRAKQPRKHPLILGIRRALGLEP